MKFGRRAFRPEQPPRPGKSTFLAVLARFGPRAAAKFLPQTPQNNSKLRPQEAKPSKPQIVRKLRNANAVPVSHKNPENSPVMPSYGQNGCLSVGSLTDKTGPQPTKCPQAPPPERPYLGPQGYIRPQTGFTAPAFSVQSTLVGGRFARNGPQNRGNTLFWRFWPV